MIDTGRIASGQPQVLLIEPGTGEALEIPLSFAAFHEEELLDYADTALATEFFKAWSAANARSLPLRGTSAWATGSRCSSAARTSLRTLNSPIWTSTGPSADSFAAATLRLVQKAGYADTNSTAYESSRLIAPMLIPTGGIGAAARVADRAAITLSEKAAANAGGVASAAMQGDHIVLGLRAYGLEETAAKAGG